MSEGYVEFQFVRGRDFISDLIAVAAHAGPGKGLTHVDLVRPDGQLLGAREDTINGIAPGVQLRPPNYASWSHVVRIRSYCADLDDYWADAMGQIGKPYDRWAIAGFVAGRDWRDPGQWFCSEFAAWDSERHGVVGKLYVEDNRVMPVTFAIALTAARGMITMDQTF